MTNEDFNKLWERAGAGQYAEKLASEYPAWRARRRRTVGAVAGLALVLAVATPLTMSHPTGYDKVYCNNATPGDSHWTALAGQLLMEA